MKSVTITHIDYLGTPSVVTGRPVVIAETIIYKALQGKYDKQFQLYYRALDNNNVHGA